MQMSSLLRDTSRTNMQTFISSYAVMIGYNLTTAVNGSDGNGSSAPSWLLVAIMLPVVAMLLLVTAIVAFEVGGEFSCL